jgi:hypothetical protein
MASWLTSSLARTTACAAVVLAFAFTSVDSRADVPVSPAPLASPSPVSTPPSGSLNIAFDQIDRTIPLPATPPPLDNFAVDLAVIQKAHASSGMDMSSDIASSIASTIVQEALSQIPIIGGFLGAAAAQAQANAMRKQAEEQLKEMTQPPDIGYATRYYFYNGWSRSEVIGLVVITKPDQHLKIFLDTKRKTYRSQDTTAPGPALAEDANASPTPAALITKADVTGSMSQVDGTNIAGLPTAAYSLDATVTLTNSADPCHDGSFQLKQLSYVAQLPEPDPQEQSQPPALYELALPDGCEVTIQDQIAGAPPPAGQMYLYRRVTVIRDPAAAAHATPRKDTSPAATIQQMFSSGNGPGPNYMLVSERSNLRPCSAADAALFDIPPDYREIR